MRVSELEVAACVQAYVSSHTRGDEAFPCTLPDPLGRKTMLIATTEAGVAHKRIF